MVKLIQKRIWKFSNKLITQINVDNFCWTFPRNCSSSKNICQGISLRFYIIFFFKLEKFLSFWPIFWTKMLNELFSWSDENKSFNRDLACQPLLQSHFWIFTPHLYSFSQLDSRLGWPNKRVKTPVVLLHRYCNRRRSERSKSIEIHVWPVVIPRSSEIRENKAKTTFFLQLNLSKIIIVVDIRSYLIQWILFFIPFFNNDTFCIVLSYF